MKKVCFRNCKLHSQCRFENLRRQKRIQEQRAKIEKYPAEWKQIRARILERDGYRCKQCGVENRAEGWRDEDGNFHLGKLEGKKVIRIVLHTAHLENPDPMDCRDENLAMFCSRCHALYDGQLHGTKIRETWEKKRQAREQEWARWREEVAWDIF